MFKVNNKDANWRRSGVFVVNSEHISHLALLFLLLTWNMQIRIHTVKLYKRMKFPIKDFLSKCDQICRNFLCSVNK